jgi:hypothetical protein
MMGTSGNIIRPSHLPTNDPGLDRLLDPACAYKSPHDVLDDRQLTLREKRAILSSWASDACAVESMPALRQIPGSPARVSFDVIMDALQRLDRLGHVRGIASESSLVDTRPHPAT